jgi:hypothetical protein
MTQTAPDIDRLVQRFPYRSSILNFINAIHEVQFGGFLSYLKKMWFTRTAQNALSSPHQGTQTDFTPCLTRFQRPWLD